ncbi:uncharacterized protein F5891DRAFT_1245404 [Suillus fuscotomentosus]|uniref:Uncharacterized protein n=1 Tax=Suillus fuscotomentosus TaxID=1912939 RepID=A0AAD4DZP4_9AGAM|nr:uncharacterized protein F5891DRAFT_1245404 [Suillus fuscotomentosus]KAG1896932.1 hypothetical protein F5891DRAFT_1245404 [Suillus fuscotomentosus]
MVTPSSSVTSASPPTTYLQPYSPSTSMDVDPIEKEDRLKAIQKVMASTELSMVTRNLRARLSYASYKATHNIPHVKLIDLEAKTRALAAAPPRLIGTKRKATTGNNYYNNPATQGTVARRGAMAPPAVSATSALSVPRSHYPTTVTGSSPNATQSLFTTLLGPPPSKQARTVRNSTDPPVQAAARSTAGSRSRGSDRASAVRSIAESTRAQSRSRKEDTTRSKPKRGDKGKQKASVADSADVERQAVATLTSLLQSRPSVASVSSPRSTLSTASDASSFQSLSQYAQSSARTTTAATSLLPSTESSFSMPRAATPPRNSGDNIYSTPHTNDEEAANLMLYLHTSPSPARPTTTRDRDTQDFAAYRALGSDSASLLTKGKILFPGQDTRSSLRSECSLTSETLPSSQDSTQPLSQPLRLDVASPGSLAPAPSLEQTIIPPTPTLSAESSSLLPSPPSPSRRSDTSNGYSGSPSSSLHAPPTPGNVPFNLNDFINVSPSPAFTAAPRAAVSLKSGPSANLRADVGRKLFEEEQQRHHYQGTHGTVSGFTDIHHDRGGVLGASIDLAST